MAAEEENSLVGSAPRQNERGSVLDRQRADEAAVGVQEALAKSDQLARSLSLMRATLDATINGILATDADGRITTYNEQYVRLWSVPADVMATNDYWQVLSFTSRYFADPAAFMLRITEIYESSEPEVLDVLELADGRVYERYSKIHSIGTQSPGRVWSFTDLTQRRRAEDAVRDESRLLEILNTTGTTLSSNLDLQTLLQAITDAATQLAGARFGALFYNGADEAAGIYRLYTVSGVPRETVQSLGSPSANPILAPTFEGEMIVRCDDLQTDARYAEWAPQFALGSGHLPVHSYLAVPVISRSGEVLGGLFFGHPATGVFTARTEKLISGVAAQAAVAIDNARLYEAAQRAAEERSNLLESERAARADAERASAMKDEFLATLSHELRTPLSAILGWAQVLRLRSIGEAELKQGLQTIERNARAQAQLIEDLLDMSRITSGKLRLDVQMLEPLTFVEAAINTLRPAVEAKGLRLETVLAGNAGRVAGDAARLQQVVWNLLSNAVKFTPTDGCVRVALRRTHAHVEISISDTGVGIKPEFLPYVFDRFRQADASTTRMFGGLGLGLSIVKRLIELHGGTVEARSAGEGTGATFVIRLPVARSGVSTAGTVLVDRKDAAANAFDFEHAHLDGIQILVVDDEADTRELVARVLTECNATVITSANAHEALDRFEEQVPDVLISDIGMPGMDGYELLKHIRARSADRGGRTPAIALTAFARSEDRTRALRAGFLVHLPKPVEPSELVATVASLACRT